MDIVAVSDVILGTIITGIVSTIGVFGTLAGIVYTVRSQRIIALAHLEAEQRRLDAEKPRFPSVPEDFPGEFP